MEANRRAFLCLGVALLGGGWHGDLMGTMKTRHELVVVVPGM